MHRLRNIRRARKWRQNLKLHKNEMLSKYLLLPFILQFCAHYYSLIEFLLITLDKTLTEWYVAYLASSETQSAAILYRKKFLNIPGWREWKMHKNLYLFDPQFKFLTSLILILTQSLKTLPHNNWKSLNLSIQIEHKSQIEINISVRIKVTRLSWQGVSKVLQIIAQFDNLFW